MDNAETGGEISLLKRRKTILERTRSLLETKKYTENQLILRDIFKAQRHIPVPPIEGDAYREYRLTQDRGLRIRLLHPDPPEHLLGADLIYETYWESKKLVRLAVVQYKIWDGKTLYTSQATNLETQLHKLKTALCDQGMCDAFKGSARETAYRLPFCSAFLRPTDELQQPDSKLISSGLHTPICVISKAWEETRQGGKKIDKKKIRSESLTHKVFEEVYNTNMLGSKWLTYEEVTALYKKHKILNSTESVTIHAQEFDL